MNVYYILPVSKFNKFEHQDIVQRKDTVRFNLAQTEFIIKLKRSGKETNEIKGIKSYTHSEIKAALNSPLWVKEEVEFREIRK